MRTPYSKRKLCAIYAKYARQRGWMDSDVAVRARVELWLEQGNESVDRAVQLHERTRVRRRSTAGSLAALAVGCSVMLFWMS